MKIKKLEDLAHTDIEYVPLDLISLLVAQEKYTDLEIAEYIARLDEFADRAKLYIKNVQGGRQAVEAFNHYFFEVEGFRANKADYFNPSNCFLNDVLDHRSGIPITLSIIYMEIGHRLGFPLSGINFPGHFLVRYDFLHESFIIDPFEKGKVLSEENCKEMLNTMYGKELPFRPEYLDPASKRQILLRLLINLKMFYISKKKFDMALPILNKILLFDPHSAEFLKERGMIHYELECFSFALNDFVNYLDKQPDAEDRTSIEECIQELKTKVELIQ